MREIKFRAWVLGKMYDVAAMDWNEYGLTIHTSGGFMTLPDEEVDLMQFTGLHDKNGVEIYEGDVVTGNWYSHKEPTDSVTGIVEYWQGWCAFIIHDTDMKVLAELNGQGAYHFDFEVIGNIHEEVSP